MRLVRKLIDFPWIVLVVGLSKTLTQYSRNGQSCIKNNSIMYENVALKFTNYGLSREISKYLPEIYKNVSEYFPITYGNFSYIFSFFYCLLIQGNVYTYTYIYTYICITVHITHCSAYVGIQSTTKFFEHLQ